MLTWKDDEDAESMYTEWRSQTLKYVAAVLRAHPEFWGGKPDIIESECDPYPLPEKGAATVEGIVRRIATAHKISTERLRGFDKDRRSIRARQEAWLLCQQIGINIKTICDYFHNRDHTTIIHGINRVQGKAKPRKRPSRRRANCKTHS